MTEPAALAGNKLSRTLSPYPPDDVRYVPTLEESLKRVEQVSLEQIPKSLRDANWRRARRVGRRRRFRRGSDPATREENARRLGVPDADEANRSPSQERRHGIDDRHRDSGQRERRIPRGAFIPAVGQRPGLSGAANCQLHFWRQLAVISARRPHPPKGRALVWRLFFVCRFGPRPGRGAADFCQHQSREYQQGHLCGDGRTAAVLEDGPDDKELADAQQAFVEAQKVGRTSDGAIAADIVSNLDLGRTFAHTAEQEKAILALTPERVTAAFRKHIDPKKLVIVRAGDFKK